MKRMTVVAAAVMLAGTGCSALGRQAFKQPKVTVQDVRVTGVGLTGGALDVLLNVDNPNGYRLDATRMTYQVNVDTMPVANGIVGSTFTVQGNASQQVHIPVNFTFAGLAAAGRALMNTGTAPYTVTGDITVGTPIGSFTIPYHQTGHITSFGGVTR
jgi:LEA14-like dessication related protein